MKQLLRILLNIATALSLVLCLMTLGLWVRSYIVSDRLFFQGWEDEADRSYWCQDMLLCGRGGIGMNRIVQSGERYSRSVPGFRAWLEARFGSLPIHSTAPAKYPYFNVGVGDEPVWGGFKRGGFTNPEPGHARPNNYGWQAVVPLWAVLVLAAPLPVLTFPSHP